MPKCIELLPCDWLISNLCYQAIERVYLIKWPVSVFYNVTYFCDAKLNFQHHYSSLQCHMIIQEYADLVFNCNQLLLLLNYQ